MYFVDRLPPFDFYLTLTTDISKSSQFGQEDFLEKKQKKFIFVQILGGGLSQELLSRSSKNH